MIYLVKASLEGCSKEDIVQLANDTQSDLGIMKVRLCVLVKKNWFEINAILNIFALNDQGYMIKNNLYLAGI